MVSGRVRGEAEPSCLLGVRDPVDNSWTDPMLLEAICEPVVLQRSVEPSATNGALQGGGAGVSCHDAAEVAACLIRGGREACTQRV
jgi:hypothetical protein